MFRHAAAALPSSRVAAPAADRGTGGTVAGRPSIRFPPVGCSGSGSGRPPLSRGRAEGLPGVLRNVMFCHGPHAQGAYSGARSGMTPSFPAGSWGYSFLFRRLSVIGIGPSSRPGFDPACRPAAEPFFARVSCVRARARLRASCAGAVRAPDCARETADALRLSAPAGVFFRAPAIASLSRNRDRGEPHGSTPPTPPCIRVRTRRFDGFKLRNGLAGRRGRACRRQPPGVRGRHAPYGLRSLGLRRSGLHPSPPAPRPVPTGCSAAWSA